MRFLFSLTIVAFLAGCLRTPAVDRSEETPDQECFVDNDCPNGRCVDGDCDEAAPEPPICDDDGFEPNDSAFDATPVAPAWQRSLILCGGDLDTYSLVLGQHRNLSVLALFDEDAQVDLRVLDDNLDELDLGDTLVDGESRIFLGGLAPAEYFIEILVRGAEPGEATPYSLSITTPSACGDGNCWQESCSDCPQDCGACAPVCEDDALEDHDFLDDPAPLAAGLQGGIVACPWDSDVWALEVDERSDLSVSLSYPHSDGTLIATLYDANWSEVAATGATDSLAADGLEAGIYLVEVYLLDDAGELGAPYSLRSTVTAAPLPSCGDGACGAAESCASCAADCGACPQCPSDALEDNDELFDARPLPLQRSGLVACQDDEDWYWIDLMVGDRLTLEVRATAGTGDLDVEIHDGLGLRDAGHTVGTVEQLTYEATYLTSTMIRVFPREDTGALGVGYSISASVAPACGNGSCDEFEGCGECAADCGACPRCGDDNCDATESCSTCSRDCGACAPSCGDGACASGETCASCAADCACPTCTPDALEENDTVAAARTVTAGTTSGLTSCTGDDDLYRVALAAGDRLDVSVTFAAAEGNIDLALLTSAGTAISTSNGTGSTETLTRTAPVAEQVLVRARLTSDAGSTPGAAYSMSLAITSGPRCGDGSCNGTETCATCAADCTCAPPPPSCGNQVIEAGEDCDPPAVGQCSPRCDLVPTAWTCPTDYWIDGRCDCGCGVTDPDCSSPSPDECDGFCAMDGSCSVGRGCSVLDPNDNSRCLASPACGDGTCNAGESCASCPADCACAPPPTCAADTLEENDSLAAARTLGVGTRSGVTLCTADDDFFRIDLAAGQTLTVDLAFTHAEGDIDLELQSSAGSRLGSASTGTGNSEHVSRTAPAAETVFIRAHLFADTGSTAGNGYSITLTVTTPTTPRCGDGSCNGTETCSSCPGDCNACACPDDAYEPNDARGAQPLLEIGVTTDLTMCSNDADFFRVDLAVGDRLDAEALFFLGEGDLDLRVIDGNGSVRASSVDGSIPESITFTAPTSASYWLEVRESTDLGTAPGVDYSLATEVVAAGPVCGDGQCAGGETCATCPSDCRGAVGSSSYCSTQCPCANAEGRCDSTSECLPGLSCSSGTCRPTSSCGDGVCSAAESCSSCAADCGACACASDYCEVGACVLDNYWELFGEDCGQNSDCQVAAGNGESGCLWPIYDCGVLSGSRPGYSFSPTLSTTDTRDYFWFYAHDNASWDFQIDVYVSNIPTGTDYDLYVYDIDGDVLGVSDALGNAPEHVTVLGMPAVNDSGWYQVEVRRYSGSSCQRYSVDIDLSECDPLAMNGCW